MKRIRCIAFLLITACLIGCTTTFRPWNLSEISEGMSHDEVVAILGEPDYIEPKDGSVYLHYIYSEYLHPSSTNVDPAKPDPDKIFPMNEQQQLKAKSYHYVVKMVDGKVQTYKQLEEVPSGIRP